MLVQNLPVAPLNTVLLRVVSSSPGPELGASTHGTVCKERLVGTDKVLVLHCAWVSGALITLVCPSYHAAVSRLPGSL